MPKPENRMVGDGCHHVKVVANIGNGGRDRTADLGVMNRVLRQNLSICLFESCSHQEFRPILHFLRLSQSGFHAVLFILDTNWTQRLGHYFNSPLYSHHGFRSTAASCGSK